MFLNSVGEKKDETAAEVVHFNYLHVAMTHIHFMLSTTAAHSDLSPDTYIHNIVETMLTTGHLFTCTTGLHEMT